jgi:hypothetical protein
MTDEGTIESKLPPKALLAVANPTMKFMLASPLHTMMSGFMMLVEFTGRKSGKKFVTPVSYHVLDDKICVFSGAPWIKNLRDADFIVVYKGQRQSARATFVEDPEQVAAALERVFKEIGPGNAQRFAFKINGPVPPASRIRDALAGRVMIVLQLQQ